MATSNLNPIIFIPGLMGSIGGEMLGCESQWSFGVASWFYRPFIKDLESLGYRLNKNLYICYYDWRKGCRDIVHEYLKPLIDEIEAVHPNEKIDLLCHSMGGIVGRTYIQGPEYRNNIRNLMCFGTPNKGSIEAYYLWSVGKVMKSKDQEKEVFEMIRRGYIWLLSKVLDIPLRTESIEKLHKTFPGLRDLIPTRDYGEILCYKAKEKYDYIPSKYSLYKNNLLNELNENMHLLENRVENIYCFIGTNYETDKVLILDTESLKQQKKAYVIGALKTKAGDGTVTVHSAAIDTAQKYIMEGSHSGILRQSIRYIADIYGLDQPLTDSDIIVSEAHPLGIILKKHMNVALKNEKGIIGRLVNGQFTTNYECICHEFGKEYIWIMLNHIPTGPYTLEAYTQYEEENDILIIGSSIEEDIVKVGLQNGQLNPMKLSFLV